MNFDFMEKLQKARHIMRASFHVLSAKRCPLHNARVGGAPRSYHKYGMACDISILNHDKRALLSALERVGLKGIGLYQNFIHVDNRPYFARFYGGPVSEALWQS